MPPWTQNHIIYEINTWVWLDDLSRKYDQSLTLAHVPAREWDALASWGFDAVWLMGVWERSPAAVRLAREQEAFLNECRRVLPDFSLKDLVGSPYAVHRYEVAERLGGPEGLAAAREQLARRGLRLILDFVPNHVATDHPWVFEHPEFFILGDTADLAGTSGCFFQAAERVLACGKDPNFPPWPDVAQLNAFNPGLRQALLDTLDSIARQGDGVRCDMAMLLLSRIFRQTWGPRAGASPAKEFWEELIPAVRKSSPDFLFIAEAYWDTERELQQQGFDYCYDKGLYDRLVSGPAESVRQHLLAEVAYQAKLLRFLENHDEPRAAATFGPGPQRAAALTVATVPGAKLFHQGQLEGWQVKLPVPLGRRPPEEVDPEVLNFYQRLLPAVESAVFRLGEWRLVECRGWPDNQSFRNLVAWCWRLVEERRLIVVNLSSSRSQGRVVVPWEELAGRSWQLRDELAGEVYEREGRDMLAPGLFVDLDAWHAHFFRFVAA